MKIEEIDQIVLVGGATYTSPIHIHTKLSELFAVIPLMTEINPMEIGNLSF